MRKYQGKTPENFLRREKCSLWGKDVVPWCNPRQKKKSIAHKALIGQKDNCVSQLDSQHVPLQRWTFLSFLSMLFCVLYSSSLCHPLPSYSVCAFIPVPNFPCSAGSGLSGREESASRCCGSEACHPASTLGKVTFPWEP